MEETKMEYELGKLMKLSPREMDLAIKPKNNSFVFLSRAIVVSLFSFIMGVVLSKKPMSKEHIGTYPLFIFGGALSSDPRQLKTHNRKMKPMLIVSLLLIFSFILGIIIGDHLGSTNAGTTVQNDTTTRYGVWKQNNEE